MGDILANWPHMGIIMAMVLVYAFLLNLALFKPIQRVLDRRKEVARGSASTVESSKAEINKKFSAYENAVTQAKIEATQAKERSRTQAQASRSEAIMGAKKEVESAIADAQRSIESDLAAAKGEIEAVAPSMAKLAASRILHRSKP